MREPIFANCERLAFLIAFIVVNSFLQFSGSRVSLNCDTFFKSKKKLYNMKSDGTHDHSMILSDCSDNYSLLWYQSLNASEAGISSGLMG